MAVSVVRPPPVYGPRDRGMLAVFKLAGRRVFPLYGLGTHRMGIVHVEDLAAAIHGLASMPGKLSFGPFYPEDGTNISWRDLVSALEKAQGRRILRLPMPPVLFKLVAAAAGCWAKLTGRPVMLSPDKVREMSYPSWECSGAALTRAAGWRPRVPLVRGLAQTRRWYRQQGWLK